jgi:predicted short-subunit dehydrogenase-like oxidoreductase (DUF2520 family)
MQTLNIIGAGRLGQSVGRLAAEAGYRIGNVMCRGLASAQAACDFIGQGVPVTALVALQPAALTLIAVPDGDIAAVAAALAASQRVAAGRVVFHASGAGEAALLAPLAAQGVYCASLHPAFSFASPARAVASFAGTRCALEGDERAFAMLQDFARAIGGQPFLLAPGGKVAYHAALTVACNYLVTLHELALQLAGRAGIGTQDAQELLGELMQKTLANSLALGPAAALTGPVVRGDAGTVASHRIMMDGAQDVLYCALGRATLGLAAGRLDGVQQAAVAAALAPRS